MRKAISFDPHRPSLMGDGGVARAGAAAESQDCGEIREAPCDSRMREIALNILFLRKRGGSP